MMQLAGSYDAYTARLEELRATSQSTSLDDWRRLSRELLNTLVDQQGTVISLQRQLIERLRVDARSAEVERLRDQADSAFAEVQRLNRLRRMVHGMLTQLRPQFA